MKASRSILFMLSLLMAAVLACNFVTGGDDPTAVPTEAPVDTPTDITPPTPTNIPTPFPTETPQDGPSEEPPTATPPPTDVGPPPTEVSPLAAFELDTAPFVHPQGIFELYPPQDWTVESSDGAVSFSPPDDSGFINVEVTNTGMTLDGGSFERFIDAREANLFGDYEAYEILEREIKQETGLALVKKRLLFEDKPQSVFTFYDQVDQVVFSVDFWADEDLALSYEVKYQEIIDTISMDGEIAASELGIYDWIFTFYGPGDLFSIEIPLPWLHENQEEETVIVDTFSSPDEHALIENITYDDGEEISKSESGAFAIELLKNFYATDIRITDDQVQSDGSERLIWDSTIGDYSGISFLETRGTTFLLFSVIWDNPFEDIYLDSLNYTITSYDIPE